jgi:hypothetical protein
LDFVTKKGIARPNISCRSIEVLVWAVAGDAAAERSFPQLEHVFVISSVTGFPQFGQNLVIYYLNAC